MKFEDINLKKRYRANIIAQTMSLIINCILYYLTSDQAFIWVAISSICFIGIITSQPENGIMDRNLFNHLIVVSVYYTLSWISFEFHFVYFALIFVFTYVFFILKDSGYDKSLTTWTYVQCLAFATTLVQIPFGTKIYSTYIAWLETQVVLWLAFKIFPSTDQYVQEEWIFNLKHIKPREWFSVIYEKVQLAIRGSVTAGVLYLVCVFLANDIKPNWSVIAAVSCLLKNDDIGSRRTIISIMIGTFIGFLISWLIIKFHTRHDELVMVLLWVNLVIAVICIFEYKITLSMKPQIIGVIAATIALTSLYVVLDLNSKFYLDLRVTNNIMGMLAASLAYLIWILYKKV